MFVSSSQLDRVYVRGSLKNNESGCEFTLKNMVDDGTLSGIKSLSVDGVEVPVASISLKTNSGERPAAELSYRSPLSLRYYAEVMVKIAGQPLAAGEHKVALGITVLEIGALELKFADEVK